MWGAAAGEGGCYIVSLPSCFRTQDGYTALHCAAATGHTDAVKPLLSARGVDVNAKTNVRGGMPS